ncbi:MAG: nicotinamide riboside transporter PnuC [Acidobacteriota bacterium]|nr:nicotinamide riboside transporter PnuC [Acidobacteriota bacterium]
MPTLELVAVIVTLAAVYLTTRQIIWCWPLGLVSVSLYAVVFFDAKLYADMGLQGFYFVLSIYGWWAWLRGGENHARLDVSVASWGVRFRALAAGAVFAAILGTLLARLTDAALPYLDSALTSFSLVAQFLATRKLLENWIVWIIVDIVYVGMFIYKDLHLTAALYATFLFLAAVGFTRWKGSMVSGARPSGAAGTA